MKYLVTGASGFIGGCLARQLRRAGHEVVALARNPGAAGDLEADGISIHQGDVRDKPSLRAPMSGIDGLFHLAAWYRNRLAMERGRLGESYIVAGPVHTFSEVFELAERLTGIPAPRIHPGPGTLKALAACMSLLGAFLALPPTYAAESLRVTAGTTYIGDDRKARRELGFAPRSLEEGLRETLRYEMERLGLGTGEVAGS